ncbi:MAG: SurA N-terminal domain-containing protein [Spirochaetaceae bacterium]|nr:SurA N-terminal domain-containing protein [Spirochaetaceae bacterium]
MKRNILFFVFLVATAGAVFAQNNLQALATIKVNKSETITLGQLKARVEVYQKQSGLSSFTLDQKKEILDTMIDERLVVQKAIKSGVTVTDSELDQYFTGMLSNMAGREVTEKEFGELVQSELSKSFDQYMKEQMGMTVNEYKAFLKNQLIAQRYVVSLKQKEIEGATVSDAEVRNAYEINKSAFVQSDTMKLFVVVVPKKGDPSAAKALCTSLYNDYKAKKLTTDSMTKQMESSKKFTCAPFYISKIPSAAAQLGIDYATLLDMFKNSKGFVSEVSENETDYQFYIILDKYDAKMLTLSDPVTPGQAVTIYEYVKGNLIEEKRNMIFQNALADVTKELRVPANYKMEKTGAALDKLLTW